LITYTERGIAEKFDTDSIFDEIHDANEVRDLDKQYDAFNILGNLIFFLLVIFNNYNLCLNLMLHKNLDPLPILFIE